MRIDSVHQGDLDGLKGVYHITCVDSVSQWQIEAFVQGLSEAYLLPVLELVWANSATHFEQGRANFSKISLVNVDAPAS